ncbi:hypothetical protein [Anabaena subtropica]|uniref:Transposase n=1 Tax=Anabaena subtropica FACHB-260 TaxID=2692884 RepID=A0ABR8CP89_9NOST|nr:hypothetical protein [Anabaena subtropica]MBD2345010.1 hypothetical protein [Anabaena subtropica FACHB-260]
MGTGEPEGQIEGWFKTAKHRFGLHRFGQGTLLGMYRWLCEHQSPLTNCTCTYLGFTSKLPEGVTALSKEPHLRFNTKDYS